MSKKEDEVKQKSQTVSIKSVEQRSEALKITPWTSYSFAPEWYEDTIQEAKMDKGHNSRRREILFAVCCVESYLFEWVRDKILNRQFDKLSNYFPQPDRRGIRYRWKQVIRAVHEDGLIVDIPDFGTPYWSEFISLVDYRDGLVHGKSSRPNTVSLADDQRPLPSKSQLDELDPGWAAKVITNLIRTLHNAAGTNPPDWLVEV